MNRRGGEKGQGFIEYLLLVVVVVVALAAFTVAYRNDTNNLDNTLTSASDDAVSAASGQ